MTPEPDPYTGAYVRAIAVSENARPIWVGVMEYAERRGLSISGAMLELIEIALGEVKDEG